MSFQTTLSFYRPTPPPRVTCADLSAFVTRFDALGLSDGQGLLGYKVKLGRSIDLDDRPTSWDEPVTPDGCISTWGEIDYDAEDTSVASLSAVAAALRNVEGTVYRAHLFLGDAERAVEDALSCDPIDEDPGLSFCDGWSLQIDPVLTFDMASDAPVMVGWMAVSLNGRGYLRALTFRQLVDRAEASESVRKLTDLCRATWPVVPEIPPRRVVKARKALGDLWPYDRPDRPWDWYWGLAEAG